MSMRATITASSSPDLVGKSWITDEDGTHVADVRAGVYGAIERALQPYLDLEDMSDAAFLELATEKVLAVLESSVECGTCRGTGWIPDDSEGWDVPDMSMSGCPDCTVSPPGGTGLREGGADAD